MTTNKAQFWGLSDSQLSRRIALGLDHPICNSFIAKHEFVSLGTSCGVVEALKALGLRKFAYPFDWTRTPLDGIVHCLQTDFIDFLSFTCREIRKHGLVYTGTRWGGAIWFHDVQNPETQSTLIRRIRRFAGEGEVKASHSRVFVWAANSVRELENTLLLRESLEQLLPEAEILLLVLVNAQSVQGPLCVNSIGWGVVFYRIDEAIFRERDESMLMARERHAYEAAVAFAINAWSTERALANVIEVQSLAELIAACDQFTGGDPACDLFHPRLIRGFPVLIDFSRLGKERQQEHMLAKRLLADALKRSQHVYDAESNLELSVTHKDENSKHASDQRRRQPKSKKGGDSRTVGNAKLITEGPLPPLQDDSLKKVVGTVVPEPHAELSVSLEVEAEKIAAQIDLSGQAYDVAKKIESPEELRERREKLELELRWWSLIEDARLYNSWPANREPGVLLSFLGVPWPPPPHFDVAVRGCLARLGAPQVANWILNVFQARGFGVIVTLTGSKSSVKNLRRIPLSALVAMRYSVSDVVWNPKLISVRAPVIEDTRFRSAEQLGSRLPTGMAGAGSLPSSAERNRVALYSDSDETDSSNLSPGD